MINVMSDVDQEEGVLDDRRLNSQSSIDETDDNLQGFSKSGHEIEAEIRGQAPDPHSI